MTFKDFKDIAPEPLDLSISGKTYTIPAVSAADGLKAWQWIRSGKKDDGQPAKVEDIAGILLGDVQQQLINDDISWQALNRVYLTVISDFTNGRRSAEAMWETGGDPKALERLTASARRDEANTTRKPDSTNGTKTSRKKPTEAR
ncbi:hypothetical protein OZX57_06520 [Bifidobacterium sp. ESL0682]|uniref:DUF7426 family protein n=1 Tax=Bifidobacterium sp. ESL0682 TaxID=2983212 RepID=UPI0023FA1433|nr:hypothetical protein [Bifidobacterium sp. ESL0682]WEV41640.1 hypothetical protein OZX57_06520 [Bifidobacterium sp. ESL0682]